MKRAEANRLEEKWHDQINREYYLPICVWFRDQLPPEYRADADDLCQNVFMKAWRHRDKVPREDPEAWLMEAALEALRRFQHQQGIEERHIATVSEEQLMRLPDPSSQVTVVEMVMDAIRELKRLSTKDADILQMPLRGYTYAEIARTHKLKDDAARKRGSRTRQHLGDRYIGHPSSPHAGPTDD